MKILFGNVDLSEYGGTQTWTETMAREAAKEHDVSFCAARNGDFYQKHLSDLGPVNLPSPVDLAILNHGGWTLRLAGYAERTVLTTHGPTHPLEKLVPGADGYFCVSEETQRLWPNYAPALALNPIDLERFQPSGYHDVPRVLVMPKNITASEMAREACGKAGLPFAYAHYRDKPEDVTAMLPDFDIVITAGRGAYEALACNRAVIIFNASLNGTTRADGWLTAESIHESVRCNCSGRAKNMQWGVDDLVACLKGYSGPSDWGREYVRQHHDVRDILPQYLEPVADRAPKLERTT